ncbi:GntR family transcriptional regulator [Mariniflexile litorale]|uniref:GntR family transcriptional regulator n=1 Tax=Mariniflexile litorale TaxID=3045158 RepID=A0AAU7EJ99_9FLAO|nr:GntR family transcriptional regulator [Mariniflexile sp. KMM 9835]MDQ8210956.1 GntR family transcriptional regulator [Mariniflexile sp. KMM 9835]
MEFKSNKGIFLQIADSLCNQILDGKLLPNERVPSVRDLASELEVNRNTVMRTFSYLQDENIFINKRGVGFFVAEKALQLIKEKEKKDFFENEEPFLLEKIRLLKLNSKDLQQIISEIKNND